MLEIKKIADGGFGRDSYLCPYCINKEMSYNKERTRLECPQCGKGWLWNDYFGCYLGLPLTEEGTQATIVNG